MSSEIKVGNAIPGPEAAGPGAVSQASGSVSLEQRDMELQAHQTGRGPNPSFKQRE